MAAGIALLLWAAGAASGDYRDDVGHTRLAAELGGALPTGNGITVSQVEGQDLNLNYMPNTNHAEFTGKTFANISDISNGVSDHATMVGQLFYGSASSMATGIHTVDVYEADNWLYGGFLNNGSFFFPGIEARNIQIHAYVGGCSDPTNAIRRLDYVIQGDGFTSVVGLNNGTGELPDLMAHSYNAISVGRSDGQHSYGTTRFDQPGRTKPDLVAPRPYVSEAVPVVAAAAALLMEKARSEGALTNAVRPECVKALLMAGASKEPFPGWSRTSGRPLDTVYGAGQVNVYNSYYTLAAGEQGPGTTSLVGRLGWDYGALAAGTNALYFFDVPASNVMTRLSAILGWNRVISNGPEPGFDPVPSVTNMDLRLYQASGFTTGDLVDVSTSQVDNVEHIYRLNLGAGRYALEVSSDAGVNYALAWFSRTARIPVLQAIAVESNAVILASDVSSNIAYAVEASTNLLDAGGWSRLVTNTSLSNLLIYVDGSSTNFDRRFYRLVPDP